MTIPTSYTEATLKVYMESELASLGTSIEIADSKLSEAVNQSILVYGVTDIVDCVNMTKIRAIARLEAWKVAMASCAEEDFERVEKNYHLARIAAIQYYPEYQVGVGTVKYTEDPYTRVFNDPRGFRWMI